MTASKSTNFRNGHISLKRSDQVQQTRGFRTGSDIRLRPDPAGPLPGVQARRRWRAERPHSLACGPTQAADRRAGRRGAAARVKAWLARRPRWHMHFIPTYSPWLNQVERFIALITDEAIRRGSFQSVTELVQKIDHFVASHNQNCKPFQWTAAADSILEKLQRLCSRIKGTGHQMTGEILFLDKRLNLR